MARMKDFIARYGHGTAKMARQAQSREKAMKKMASNATEKVDKDYTFDFGFENVEEFFGTLIEVKGVDFGYSEDKIL